MQQQECREEIARIRLDLAAKPNGVVRNRQNRDRQHLGGPGEQSAGNLSHHEQAGDGTHAGKQAQRPGMKPHPQRVEFFDQQEPQRGDLVVDQRAEQAGEIAVDEVVGELVLVAPERERERIPHQAEQDANAHPQPGPLREGAGDRAREPPAAGQRSGPLRPDVRGGDDWSFHGSLTAKSSVRPQAQPGSPGWHRWQSVRACRVGTPPPEQVPSCSARVHLGLCQRARPQPGAAPQTRLVPGGGEDSTRVGGLPSPTRDQSKW